MLGGLPDARPAAGDEGGLAGELGGGGQPGALDDIARRERASSRHRAAGPAPLGGSSRLLSVDELAVYLGVPKKTVYGCWPGRGPGSPRRPLPVRLTCRVVVTCGRCLYLPVM